LTNATGNPHNNAKLPLNNLLWVYIHPDVC